MPRTLIFGTSYVGDQQAKWLLEQWVEVNRRLNSSKDCAVLIVDSASPCLPAGLNVFQLGKNIGHLSRTGQDGWGKAFCVGLEMAAQKGFDYVVHIETDLLFARPVAPIIDRMARFGVGAAAPMANPWHYIETALLFLDMRWVRESDFIARYDWEHSPAAPLPEQRVQAILADKLWALPLRGMRNDLGALTAGNMAGRFPEGIDYLTHATPATFRAFLAMNDLQEA